MKKSIFFILLFINTGLFAQKVISVDPELNFEKFWTAYEQKYPFFADKKINWQSEYKKYRPLVNKSISNDSLFQILAHLIAPLNDAHVEVHTHGEKIEKKFWARKPSKFSNEFQFSKDSLHYFWRAVDSTLFHKGFTNIKSSGGIYEDSLRQFYYSKSKDLGYIRFIDCSFGNGSSGINLLELDTIFSFLNSPKALILDIRFNRGGGEGVALKVAGRFADKTPKGALRYRRKKKGGYSDFVKLSSFRNKPHPSKRTKYLGPVYLLTNDRTVSAGDLLALYMSQLPNVTIIGDNTEGSFDGFRYEFLPNGWHFSVPQKRYVRATDNLSYEGVGISPDIKVANKRIDINEKIDRVLLRVFEELEKNK